MYRPLHFDLEVEAYSSLYPDFFSVSDMTGGMSGKCEWWKKDLGGRNFDASLIFVV